MPDIGTDVLDVDVVVVQTIVSKWSVQNIVGESALTNADTIDVQVVDETSLAVALSGGKSIDDEMCIGEGVFRGLTGIEGSPDDLNGADVNVASKKG